MFDRETSSVRVSSLFTRVSASVGATVEATNKQLENSTSAFEYDRSNPKRQCRGPSKDVTTAVKDKKGDRPLGTHQRSASAREKDLTVPFYAPTAAEEQESLAAMIAVLCEQQHFVPLLRAFELFTPTSPLLPFIRFLQVSFDECCICVSQTVINIISIQCSIVSLRVYYIYWCCVETKR